MRAQIVRAEHGDGLGQPAEPVPDRPRLAGRRRVPLAPDDVVVEVVVAAPAIREHVAGVSGPLDGPGERRSPHIGKVDALVAAVGEFPEPAREEMLGGKIPGFNVVDVCHAESRTDLSVEHVDDRFPRTPQDSLHVVVQHAGDERVVSRQVPGAVQIAPLQHAQRHLLVLARK